MLKPRYETEDLLLSETKNCETLNEPTLTKPQETLNFRLTQPRKIISLASPIPMDGSWMIGLTSLKVYHSFLK